MLCFLAEPQANAGLINAVEGELPVAILDQLGAGLTLGPDFYGALLQSLADGLEPCHSGS